MPEFYPKIEPFDKGFLKVSEIHTIYYEQVGNPKGQPILFLHGGPGGGLSEDHRRYFDPSYYRVILFDQRGCGQSTPHAELRENTTWDLVNDIEKLREKFAIEKWMLFGGSWGSTLALTYAVTHPEKVQALILRGIFLCRPSEIHWFYQEGASQLFPDHWEKYLAPIPPGERGQMVKAYYQRLTAENRDIQIQAARAWSQWESTTAYLQATQEAIDSYEDPMLSLPFARIECHYFINNAFFPSDNYLLENVHKIKNIPGVIVQGRYDVVCPARSAWDLHKNWPSSEIFIISDAGHSASEPGIRSALIEATNRFRAST